jgi:RNA polymerase sigma factor (sigma-70 family)
MMKQQHFGEVLHRLRGVLGAARNGEPTDRQLLERFAAAQDQRAFVTLVRRHGAMVLGLCRRTLGQEQDAEDAFQATFLVLAQKAGSLRWSDSVGHWLHEVAHRIALRVKTSRLRRCVHEMEAGEMAKRDASVPRADWRAFCSILDDELQRLPEKYRAPLVLCYLEGQAQAVASERLGCSEATLNRRLAEGREQLRIRLERRGITLSAALLAIGVSREAASASVPAALAATTLKGAVQTAAGQMLEGVSAKVLSLAGETMQTMTCTTAKLGMTLFLAISLIAGTGLLAYQNLGQSGDDAKGTPGSKDPANQKRGAEEDPLPVGAIARLGSLRLQQDDRISMLAFSPDGTTLVTSGGLSDGQQRLMRGFVVGRMGRFERRGPDPRQTRITLWDPVSGKELRKLQGIGTTAPPTGLRGIAKVAFSPDGKTLLLLGVQTTGQESVPVFQVSDVATGKEMSQVKCPGLPLGGSGSGIEFSPDGKTIAVTSNMQERPQLVKGAIQLWDSGTGKRIAEWAGDSSINTLAFSPNGKLLALASAAKDAAVRLWDIQTQKELRRMEGSEGYGRLAFSPDGKLLAATGTANTATVWDAATGKAIHKLEGHKGVLWSLAFSPDGKTIASTGADNMVRLWSCDTGKVQHEWKVALNGFTPLAFSANGKVLAVGTTGTDSTRGMVRLLETLTGREVGPKARSHAPLHRVACSSDGRIIATVGKDDVVRLWEAASGKEIRAFSDDGATSLALSPDGKKLIVVGQDATVRLRDASSGKELSKFELATDGPVPRSFFSPDGKLLLAVGQKSEVALWNVDTGKVVRSFKLPTPEVRSAAISLDGKRVAIGGNGRIYIWDVATGRVLSWKKKREMLTPDGALALSFSPDGHYLASSQPQSIRIWEVATGEVVDERKVTGTPIFSPDGRVLAAVSGNQVHLVDLASSNDLPVLTGHQWKVNSVAFSLDSKRLVSVSDDTTGLVWDAARLIPNVQPLERSRRDLRAIWRDLGDDDETVAYRATWDLANSKAATFALLREWLRPEPVSPDAKHSNQLIADLDSPEFKTRTKAFDELEDLEGKAESTIRLALRSGPTLEVRRQLEKLLARVNRMSLDRLRQLRAITALERASNPEAYGLLKALASGDEGAWLTEEAKNTLERIARSRSVP